MRQFLAFAVTTLAAPALLASGATASPLRSSDLAPVMVTVTVDPTTPGLALPAHFLGLSGEPANTCALVSLAGAGPSLPNLIRGLGVGTLRIGGNTGEGHVHWSPTGIAACSTASTTMTPGLVAGVAALAQQVGWQLVWQLPLNTPAGAASVAAEGVAVAAQVPASLEIGNEPDLYRATGNIVRDPALAMAAWLADYNALRAAGVSTPVSGPAVSGPNAAYLAPFLRQYSGRISGISVHKYFGMASTTTPLTTANLLSPATAVAEHSVIAQSLTQGRPYGLPVTVNESNSYVGFGQAGVSDAFASALWAPDWAAVALEGGVKGLYFHGIPNSVTGNTAGVPEVYSPLHADGTPAPEYYGLMLFSRAIAGGGNVLPEQVSTGGANVVSHAFLGNDGTVRVMLINKDPLLDASVTVNLGASSAVTSGQVLRLAAPSVSSTSGVTLGGAEVATDGTWSATTSEVTAVSSGTATLVVPAGSAALVTLSS